MARTNIDVDLQSLSSEQRQLNAIASIEDIYKTYKRDYVVQSASSTTLKKAELTQDYKDNASQLSDTQTLKSETNYEELCSTSSTLQLEEQQKFKEPQQKMENNGETSVPEHLAGNFCNFRIASGQGPDKQNTNDASPEEYQCNNNCCKCEQMQMPNAKNNVRFADNCNQGSSSSNNNSNCSSNSNMYPMDATQYYQQLQMQGLNANNYDYFGYGMAPPGAESAYPCQYPQMQQQQQQQQQQDYRNYAPSYQMPNTNFENCMSNGSYAPASLQAGQQCSNEEISSQCSEQAAAQCSCNNSQHSELSQQKSDSSEAHSMHEVNSQRGFEMPEGADCISHMLPNPLTEMTQMSRPINMGMGMGMGSCSCSFEPTQANMGSCMSCAAPQQGSNCLDIEAFMLQQQQQQQPQQQQQQHCYSNPITVPSQMQSQGMPCNLQMPGNYAPASGMAPVPVPSCFMPMTMPTPCGMPCCNPNQGAANDNLQTQTVYTTDYRPFNSGGNNFNHFPNAGASGGGGCMDAAAICGCGPMGGGSAQQANCYSYDMPCCMPQMCCAPPCYSMPMSCCQQPCYMPCSMPCEMPVAPPAQCGGGLGGMGVPLCMSQATSCNLNQCEGN